MLPPQLRASTSVVIASSPSTAHISSALLRVGVAKSQHRSLSLGKYLHWGSQLDTSYHRLNRYHTLKCHAKLLKTLQRRRTLDWDESLRPLMSDKHQRWASHCNGSAAARKWLKQNADEHGRKNGDEDAAKVDSGASSTNNHVELTHREKKWKEIMEAMKKKIERDPYEAVFGKRFEPFWSPLVPIWMREELGSLGRSKIKSKSTPSPTDELCNETTSRAETDPWHVKKRQTDMKIPGTTEVAGRPDLSSSYSATSYDSWTDKANRTEWDSVSGRTKHFEYDPISNRMVQIEPTNTPKATQEPKETTDRERTAIALPTYPKNVIIEPVEPVIEASKKSHVTLQSRGHRPAALSKLPENDLDLLTADNVRASMGKTQASATRTSSLEQKNAMEADFISKSRDRDADTDAVLRERENKKIDLARKMTYWDDLQREAPKEPYYQGLEQNQSSVTENQQSLDNDLQRFESRQKISNSFNLEEDPDDSAAHESTEPIVSSRKILLSSVERMQSKPLPSRVHEDLDDSAAHESTEPIESVSIPKNWSEQADLLQSSRVHRASQAFAMQELQGERAEESTNNLREGQFARQVNTLTSEKEDLRKANEMLIAQVEEQKFRLHSHETRYAQKIRSLRQDLNVAYTESSRTSQDHIERIRKLEDALEKAQKVAGDSPPPNNLAIGSTTKNTRGEMDFCSNVVELADSDKWYKHSTNRPIVTEWEIQKTEQKMRDQALVQEVRAIYEKQYGKIDIDHKRVTHISTQSSVPQTPARDIKVAEVETDVDLGEALAKHEEDQDSYVFKQDGAENNHETSITELDRSLTKHEQTRSTSTALSQAAKAEPLSDLENALAQHEQGKPLYSYKDDGLADEIALQEKKTRQAILAAEKEHKAKWDELLKTPMASEPVSIQIDDFLSWEDPPVYKVLAYDPGNDKFSTATTTSNFTLSEQPISIPQALSQLYQPARFVPYFAELQKDGYQVIYGTRDLLVFKKVQTAELTRTASTKPEGEMILDSNTPFTAKVTVKDYFDPTSIENGSLKPKENAMAQEAANAYDANRHAINPIDGTSRPIATGNFASPTGFVNHDAIAPANDAISANVREDDIACPRVRREEPVFSGAKSARRQQLRAEKAARREERRRRRRSGAGALRWALTVGLGTAALTYTIGVAAETAREDKKKERWQRILEGRD